MTSNAAVGALSATLQTNFSQVICSMSAKARTLNPASLHTRSIASARSVRPPRISPMRIMRIPLWCTAPGAGIDEPKPSAMPMTTCSAPTWRVTRSPAPRPFWNGMTTSAGRSSGARSAMTPSTSAAFVAMTHTSQGPASDGRAPTRMESTTYSPLAPDTCSPPASIASRWSCQRSIAQTSWPDLPSIAAYTAPIAPVPTIPIFIVPPLLAGTPGSAPRRPPP